jgi:hypothetical protein
MGGFGVDHERIRFAVLMRALKYLYPGQEIATCARAKS